MSEASGPLEPQSLHSGLLYTRVAGLIFGQPLLVMPDVAETIGNFVRARMEGQATPEPEANRFIGRQAMDPHSGAWKGYRRSGPAGIVTILGELVNRGAWLGASSGLTSYEGIIEQVRQAAADPDARELVLDINSPGGEAYGMSDAARSIRSIAGAAGKKVTAVINSIGASAAYGLASAADEIVVTESGVAGSIGVVMVHYDVSDRASKMGVRATVITSGRNKATGHPFAPLDDESRAHLQAKVDRIMDGFTKLVADHRPGLTEDAVRGFEANTFIGNDAVAAGLADRVGTFEDVIGQITRAQSSGRSHSQQRRTSMSDTTTAPAADANAGIPKAEHDRLVAAARQEGHTAGKAEGLTEGKAQGIVEGKAQGAEEASARIAAILDHENAKGREQMARHLAFKTQMPVEDAAALLATAAKEQTGGSSLSERMKSAATTNTSVPPAPGTEAQVDPRERGRQITLAALGKKPAA